VSGHRPRPAWNLSTSDLVVALAKREWL